MADVAVSSGMTLFLATFAASFLYIFLKAWQQLNVVHHQLWWIMPTSFAMAACEVFIVFQSAHRGWGWIVIPIGLGAGLGCLSSMVLHKRMIKRDPIN